MPSNIIKNIIKLDKTARDEIKKLEHEKATIDDVIHDEVSILKKQIQHEIKHTVTQKVGQFKSEIEKLQTAQQEEYEKHLKIIEDTFKKHQKEWIDHLFEHTIK